jgi:hypothetical protein
MKDTTKTTLALIGGIGLIIVGLVSESNKMDRIDKRLKALESQSETNVWRKLAWQMGDETMIPNFEWDGTNYIHPIMVTNIVWKTNVVDTFKEVFGKPLELIRVTNYAEFGPDGYGYRHLCKQDSELVHDCLTRMDDPWKHPILLEDLTVTKTVTHDVMTGNEIMDIIGFNPNVATVSLAVGAKRSVFSLDTLAYPQYANDYRLTKAQWRSLQDYCRLQLIDPIAVDEVVKHWQSITNGIVPFGLRVME